MRFSSLQISGSDKERRSFHYFRERTRPQLSELCYEDFWDRLVLQATHYEPAIRHAIIALGSLHEHFEKNDGLICRKDPSLYNDNFALQQYNLAIKHLLEPFSRKARGNMDVCLISCILFASFETMLGSLGSAIAYLQSGSKILCEIQYNELMKQHQHEHLVTSAVPYVRMELLEDIYLRLDLQVTQMVGGQKWDVYQKRIRYRPKNPIPPIFLGPQEAREALVLHWLTCSYELDKLWKKQAVDFQREFYTWQHNTSRVLDEWSSALAALIELRGETMSTNERNSLRVLQIQKTLGLTATRLARTKIDDQTLWDQFSPLFEEIVSLAAEVVESNDNSLTQKPSFSLDLGIVAPLYEVASRCRDPFIRRRAISVLKSAGRHEGIWNSFLTAQVAERVVLIEESGLGEVRSCEDVPGWARISEVQPIFDPLARRATLRYSRSEGENGCARQLVEEILEW